MMNPPAPSTPLFQVEALHKEFDGGKVKALRGVDFEVAQGEFVSIIGQSGSGKSTLLQMLGGLDEPDQGAIRFRGNSIYHQRDVAAFRAKEIGFIFQAFHLLPTFTALENVQIPMFEMPWSAQERTQRAKELLESVGLGHRLEHLPTKLSGGERQRVAIARSLANGPSVLLADEPTGNLDSENAANVLELIVNLHRQQNMTMVLVTHDLGIARRADRTIHMRDGQIVNPPEAATTQP